MKIVPERMKKLFKKHDRFFSYFLAFIASFLIIGFIKLLSLESGNGFRMNYFYVFCFALSFVITIISAAEMMTGHPYYKPYNNWWRRVLKFFYIFTASSSFVWGTLFISLQSETAILSRITLMANILIAMLVYNIFCLLFVFFRYEVEEDSIIIKKGKVYYPGQRYIKWPSSNSRKDLSHVVIPERISFNLNEKWQGKDFSQKLLVVTSVILDKDKAESEGVKDLDYDEFTKEVENFLIRRIKEYLKLTTCSEFLRCKLDNDLYEKTYICGFPIVWSGNLFIHN